VKMSSKWASIELMCAANKLQSSCVMKDSGVRMGFTEPQLFMHCCNIDSFITVISLWLYLVFSHCVIKICFNISEEDAGVILRVTESGSCGC
jgi:hypothetical protein